MLSLREGVLKNDDELGMERGRQRLVRVELHDELKRDSCSQNRVSDSDIHAIGNEVAHSFLEIVLGSSETDFALKDEISEGFSSADGHGWEGKLEATVLSNTINKVLQSFRRVNIDGKRYRSADGALRIDAVLKSVGVDSSATRIGHIVFQVNAMSS